jgi:hypothetical protein
VSHIPHSGFLHLRRFELGHTHFFVPFFMFVPEYTFCHVSSQMRFDKSHSDFVPASLQL